MDDSCFTCLLLNVHSSALYSGYLWLLIKSIRGHLLSAVTYNVGMIYGGCDALRLIFFVTNYEYESDLNAVV